MSGKPVLEDKVYMLYHPDKGFLYSRPSTNQHHCWADASDFYFQGIILARQARIESMKKDGWRAKKVHIRLIGK